MWAVLLLSLTSGGAVAESIEFSRLNEIRTIDRGVWVTEGDLTQNQVNSVGPALLLYFVGFNLYGQLYPGPLDP